MSRQERTQQIIQGLIQGVKHVDIRGFADTDLLSQLVQYHNPELIQRYLLAYGPELTPFNVKMLLREIIRNAPEMIPMTDSMVQFYDSDLFQLLMQTSIDFSGLLPYLSSDQINDLFIAALHQLRNDVLTYLYSRGYKPSPDTLSEALSEIAESYSSDPSPGYREEILWLLSQGAEPSTGIIQLIGPTGDLELVRALLEAGAPPEDVEEAIQLAENADIEAGLQSLIPSTGRSS
jgi:hypothetical protein